jgi:predicted nuclease of predicted toxin-antitoxin system
MSSIAIVIDMNLSTEWVGEFASWGIDAIHWSSVGDASANDREIMTWARINQRMIFTHDLDFGSMLALTHANGPSVLQIRGRDVLPDTIGPVIKMTLVQYESELLTGALVVVDRLRMRVRILPI